MNENTLKERLNTISKELGVAFNDCWKRLLLERFLARIASSKRKEKLAFKGGFLLSYLIESNRETVDLDFLLTKTNQLLLGTFATPYKLILGLVMK